MASPQNQVLTQAICQALLNQGIPVASIGTLGLQVNAGTGTTSTTTSTTTASVSIQLVGTSLSLFKSGLLLTGC